METSRGLPNSCYQCATPIPASGTWFARNVDEARSGKGLCAECVASASPVVTPGAAPAAAPVTIEPETVTLDETDSEAPAEAEQQPLPDFLLPKDNLTEIPGLGSTSQRKLNKAGILTFADLRTANVPALAVETGIKEEKLQSWLDYFEIEA